MKETDPIQVLGRGTDVQFTIDDTVPFEIAERSLREYLDVCRGLYSRGTVSVNVGRRILAPDQLSTIKGILAEETGLTVTEYWCPPEILREAMAGPDSRRALPSPQNGASSNDFHAAKNADLSTERSSALKIGESPDSPTGASEALILPDSPQIAQLQFVFPGLEPESAHPQPPSTGVRARDTDPVTKEDASTGPAAEPTSKGGLDSSVIPFAVASVFPAEYAGTEEAPGIPAAPGDSPEEDHESNIDVNVSGSTTGDQGVAQDGVLLSPPIRGNEALIIKTTCRSGEMVHYPGDVVVFGDVNPGAEIVASGDIIVLGALRGMAHAGCDGDTGATIFALNLEAHRLQIGPHAGESPRGQRRARSGNRSVNPQIAYIRRSSIFVAPFVRRREEYQGGVLYEG